MPTVDADTLLNEATQLLQTADDELNRSEEDVISFLVCFNSRQAIINAMSAFLMRNNIEPQKPITMEGLLKQCAEEDGRFQDVDMSEINCKHEEDSEEYCLSVGKVNSCYNIAKIIHGIVSNRAPGF